MSIIFTSAEAAEEAFYDAISRADLDALMSVWADEVEIVCIHPTGQCLIGALAIRSSWQDILANNPRLKVRVKRNICWEGVLFAVHSVVETIFLGNAPTPHGPMLSTNVFQRGANGWRLLSHHSSTAATSAITDPTTSESPEGGQRTLH